MSETQKIPWKRISVESAAIVASILLAFAIDAWWENRTDRGEERELLFALQLELQKNIALVDSSLVFRRAVLASTTELLEVSAHNVRMPATELDNLLGALVWWRFTQPSTGVLQSLVQGGKLSLVELKTLRSEIASLSTHYQYLDQIERQHYETFKFVLMPYLYENVVVAQLSNAQPSSPGIGESPQPSLPIGAPMNHQRLLEDQEFIGIVTNVYWDQNDAIGTLTDVRTVLQELVDEIGSAIAR